MPTDTPRVFVSYARRDGEEVARELRERLRHERIPLWRDREGLEGGRDWWLQITDALDRVVFLVLVMTPAALASELVRREWRYARQRGVTVYPVIGVPGLDFDAMPRWMRSVHFYDLAHEWPKFVNDLNTTPQPRRVPFMVEELPADHVPRHALLERLVPHLVDRTRGEPLARITALRGAGGYGKTALARAACHDEAVQAAFDDGILWVTLGENPGDLTGRVEDLIHMLGGQRAGFAGLEAAGAALAELLAERELLIVIDDLWDAAHAQPFLRGGARCARLITTRNVDTLPPGTQRLDVAEMQRDEAAALLGHALPADDGAALAALAGRLGEWPLLLKLVNGALRERVQQGQGLRDGAGLGRQGAGQTRPDLLRRTRRRPPRARRRADARPEPRPAERRRARALRRAGGVSGGPGRPAGDAGALLAAHRRARRVRHRGAVRTAAPALAAAGLRPRAAPHPAARRDPPLPARAARRQCGHPARRAARGAAARHARLGRPRAAGTLPVGPARGAPRRSRARRRTAAHRVRPALPGRQDTRAPRLRDRGRPAGRRTGGARRRGPAALAHRLRAMPAPAGPLRQPRRAAHHAVRPPAAARRRAGRARAGAASHPAAPAAGPAAPGPAAQPRAGARHAARLRDQPGRHACRRRRRRRPHPPVGAVLRPRAGGAGRPHQLGAPAGVLPGRPAPRIGRPGPPAAPVGCRGRHRTRLARRPHRRPDRLRRVRRRQRRSPAARWTARCACGTRRARPASRHWRATGTRNAAAGWSAAAARATGPR